MSWLSEGWNNLTGGADPLATIATGGANLLGNPLAGGADKLISDIGNIGKTQYQAQLDPQALAQQQAFINALQAQSQGLGPNLAQAQLAQATSAAQKQAAGMAASQKGINPALAQRQALMNQANMQQQAAGQAGMLAAQQQLQTQGMLGQQITNRQAQNLQAQGINAGIAQGNAANQAALTGGLIKGAAAALTASQGGEIPGKPVVDGDSLKNDNVPAMLSPGEIVIPRSIATHKNAPALAAKFVRDTLKNKPEMKENFYDGGQEPDFVGPDILGKTLESLAQQIPTAPAAEPSLMDKVFSDVKARNQAFAQGQWGPSVMQRAGQSVHDIRQSLTPKTVTPEQAKLLGIDLPQVPQTAPVAPITNEQGMTVAPQASNQPMAMAGQAPADIFGYGAIGTALQKGLNLQKAGIYGEAKAAGDLGREQSYILDKYQTELANRQRDYEANTAGIQDLIKTTTQELNKSIDPNKYMGDLSTAGKISTMIGLVLGGIGGGITKTGGNVALDILNKNIDRDIAAQKSSLDQKATLLSGYYKQLGNMKDAEMMTRATMQDLVSTNLKELADKAQEPMAKARAMQMAGQIDAANAQTIGLLSARKTMMEGAAGKAVDPSLMIRAMVPENQQKEYYKELQEMQNTVTSRDHILSAFNKTAQLATIPNYLTSPISTTRQVKAITEPLTAALSKETAGRFTEQDAGMLESLWPKAGDSAQDIRVKKKQLDDLISAKMNFPMLKPLGITPESMSRFAFGKGGEKGITLGKPVLGGK